MRRPILVLATHACPMTVDRVGRCAWEQLLSSMANVRWRKNTPSTALWSLSQTRPEQMLEAVKMPAAPVQHGMRTSPKDFSARMDEYGSEGLGPDWADPPEGDAAGEASGIMIAGLPIPEGRSSMCDSDKG